MRKILLLTGLMMLMATSSLSAQTVIDKTGAIHGWKHSVDPSGYQFDRSIDSQPFESVTAVCSTPVAPETVWRCRVPLPALSPGQHTIQVRARAVINGATVTSDPSQPLTIVYQVVEVPFDQFIENPPVQAKPAVKKPGGGR